MYNILSLTSGGTTMRTTIDIPPHLRQKLISEAAARHLKGFSNLVVEALEQYFAKGTNNDRKETASRLKGCLNEAEYDDEMMRIQEARSNWRK